MTFNFLGPGLTVNVEAKVKEQIILDSSESENKRNKPEIINLSTYDRKKIERYENCLSFLLIFFPPQTLRYRLIKKAARRIYNFMKKYVTDQ